MRSKILKKYEYYLFFIPAAVIILGFIFSAIVSIGLSFYDCSIFRGLSFCGLENYKKLINDSVFWQSYFNVFESWFIRIFGEVIFPLFIAVLINSINKGKKFFRTIFFLPVIVSIVSSAIIWRWLYEPSLSIINYYLKQVGIGGINWLSSPDIAMISVTIMSIWVWWGFNLVIFVAALTTVQKDLYDAAEVDGASGWQKFLHVTLPHLRPVMLFVIIVTSIRCFQLFEEPYCLTSGAPLNRTLSPVMYIYKQGFEYYNLGYASTIAVSLFVVLMLFSIFQINFMKER